jgi:4-amino-4-deoxy-L-arabinose transferase-like glycosyltransferase
MRNHSKGTYLAHILFLAAATVALLFPFVDKAFHIDDTLFLWTARQIVERPWDFYGFQGNWDGAISPATAIIKNPPVAAYYMAFAGWLGGFSERTLHLAFMFPAVMAVWGAYSLARRMSTQPLLAAILCLATPAFLVSSTTLMCDVMLAAFWVWAAFFWIKGVEDSSRFSLFFRRLIALAPYQIFRRASSPLYVHSFFAGSFALFLLLHLLPPSALPFTRRYSTARLRGLAYWPI